jgi:aspartyl/asparaginyl beta-hydroxylase (cupin superfamily)
MSAAVGKTRALYAELIATLVAEGRQSEAQACARLAVEQGIWRQPFQRPVDYVAGLPAVVNYDPRKIWVTRHLEDNFETIRSELARVTDPARFGFTPVEEPLLGDGRWDQVVFYEAGQRFQRAAELFPATAAVIDDLPEAVRAAGVIMFSWLHPGSHIVPHCGLTNARLRIHLGITTPPGAHIRVHDKTFTWTAGKCLVFDDSIEHEVWHRGTESRAVLLLDIMHPALSDSEKEKMLQKARVAPENKIRQMMSDRGFRHVERAADGAIRFELNRDTELLVGRHMRDSGIRWIDLSEEGRVLVGLEQGE